MPWLCRFHAHLQSHVLRGPCLSSHDHRSALAGAQQKQELEALRQRLGLSCSQAADSTGQNNGSHSQRSFHTASTSRLEVCYIPVSAV